MVHLLDLQRLIPAHAGKTLRCGCRCGRIWAHPRSRGENPSKARPCCRLRGSSPLTRGKPGLSARTLRRVRLIPAHAGKTPVRGGARGCDGAHPRSRGENALPQSQSHRSGGSSPLTRGKPRCAASSRIKRGLIPAHAGKTRRRRRARRGRRAHPRSRGENDEWSPPGAPKSGSSPLTRGKRPRCRCGRRPRRLIPAHAGKTGEWLPAVWAVRAHPRSRGENCSAL